LEKTVKNDEEALRLMTIPIADYRFPFGAMTWVGIIWEGELKPEQCKSETAVIIFGPPFGTGPFGGGG